MPFMMSIYLLPDLLSFYEAVQQSLAGIFQERDNELEVAVVAVVWIGHGGVFTMVGQEICHAHHLVLVSLAGSHGGDGAVVLVVHYYDGFESPEIGFLELAGVTVEIVAMLGSAFSHAAVGQLTYVPVSDSCRIDFKLILQPCFFHQALHDALSGRRAADVAQANE